MTTHTDRNGQAPPVTFIIFGYNQEKLVDQAIAGAFAQDYDNLEVILSDDCSRDGTHTRMVAAAAAYRGPHRVIVNRTPVNRGTFAHAHHAVSRSSGALLVMAAADDISYPSRVSRLVAEWQRTGAAALFSKYDVIDGAGKIIQRNYRYDHSQLEYLSYFGDDPVVSIHGASSAYAREVFNLFKLPSRPILFEDTYLTLGLTMLRRPIVYVDEALVQYRKHEQSTTNAGEVGSTRDEVLDRESRAQSAASSIVTVLEEMQALARATRDARALKLDLVERDLLFYRHRAGWIEAPAAAHVKAIARARRWPHLKWLLARSAGVGGLAVAKSLRRGARKVIGSASGRK
jgi:glycosyltransferase involved in cell wall biosynthesis